MRIERAALFAALAIAGGVPAAQADGDAFRFGAGLSAGSETNVFRAPPGQESSDHYVGASLSAQVDETFGRQRLQAGLTVRRSDYSRLDDLDNTGYGLSGDWSGSTAGDLSWKLSYATNRSLASYTSVIEPDRRVANVETSRQLIAAAQLGRVAQWVASVTASHRSIGYSAAAYAQDEYRLDSLGTSAQWRPLGPLSVTLGPRLTRGRFPQARLNADGSASADRFERQDIDLSTVWLVTGASTVTGRLSLTRQRYDLLSDRDFSGATGQFGWTWAATGKTRLNAELSRDTGSETSFFSVAVLGQQVRGSGDNSQLTTRLAARLDHDLTGKVSVNLGLQAAQRQLAASSRLATGGVVLDDEAGRERSGTVSLGLRYAAARSVSLGCDLAHERRTSDTVLSSTYRGNSLSCYGQLTLRP